MSNRQEKNCFSCGSTFVRACPVNTNQPSECGLCLRSRKLPLILSELHFETNEESQDVEMALTKFDDDYKNEPYDDHWCHTPIASTSSAHDSTSDYNPEVDEIDLDNLNEFSNINQELGIMPVVIPMAVVVTDHVPIRLVAKAKRLSNIVDLTAPEVIDLECSKKREREELEDEIRELKKQNLMLRRMLNKKDLTESEIIIIDSN